MSEQNVNEKNLDDLILEEPEPTNNKKGLLLILGLVVLLLIIGVVLANMIMGSEESNTTKQIQQKHIATVTSNEAKGNFDNTAMDEKNDLDADLAPLDSENDKKALDNSDLNEIDNESINTNEQEEDKNPEPNMQESPKVKEEPKKEEVKSVRRSETKKHVVKKKYHLKKTPQHKRVVSYGGVGNIYIQVGSFKKGPNEAFIDKIRRSGFKYKIQEAGEFRRVLVGPFRSRNEAMQVLGIVKSKISSAAFIKR